MKRQYTGTVSGLFKEKGYGFLNGPDGGAYFDRSKIGDEKFEDMVYYFDQQEPITYTALYVGGTKDSKWHVVEVSASAEQTEPQQAAQVKIRALKKRASVVAQQKDQTEVGLTELAILLLKILEEVKKLTAYIED